MTEQEKQAVIDVLGRTDEHRFYVYALVDPRNNQHFYIGKGQGDRIWQHEYGADYEKNKILEDSNLSEEEKINQIENISKKQAVINSIKEEGYDVQNAIIKWGLTEEEAFSAESALINLCKYQGIELTNIQNGHASEKEKDSGLGTTKALTDKEFYNVNAKSPIYFSSLSYNEIGHKIIFVNIATNYEAGMTNEVIKDIARGRWVINNNRLGDIEYLFALNKSVVRGVYKITKSYSGLDTDDFPVVTEACTKIYKNRLNEKTLIEQLKKYADANGNVAYDNLPTDIQNLFEDAKKFNAWFNRKYFSCVNAIGFEHYIGHRIINEDGSSIYSGGTTRFN